MPSQAPPVWPCASWLSLDGEAGTVGNLIERQRPLYREHSHHHISLIRQPTDNRTVCAVRDYLPVFILRESDVIPGFHAVPACAAAAIEISTSRNAGGVAFLISVLRLPPTIETRPLRRAYS